MKIEEKFKKSFWCYNEALGVSLSKKRVLKKKKKFCLGYCEKLITLVLLLFILASLAFLNEMEYLANYLCLLIAIFLTLLVFRIVYYFCKNKSEIVTTINKEGITDTSFYEMSLLIPWSKIMGVVIKKNSVTILTNTPILLYFEPELKDILLKYIKKYNEDILIIE